MWYFRTVMYCHLLVCNGMYRYVPICPFFPESERTGPPVGSRQHSTTRSLAADAGGASNDRTDDDETLQTAMRVMALAEIGSQRAVSRESRLGYGCCRNVNRILGSQRAVSRESRWGCGCCRNINRNLVRSVSGNIASPAPADMGLRQQPQERRKSFAGPAPWHSHQQSGECIFCIFNFDLHILHIFYIFCIFWTNLKCLLIWHILHIFSHILQIFDIICVIFFANCFAIFFAYSAYFTY